MATWPRFRPTLPDPKHLGPVVLAWVVAVVVMTAEKDLGSSLLFFTLFVVMLWVATERVAYVGFGSVLFAAAAYGAWTQFAHVQERVTNWLNPWKDASDKGLQVIQSWYAMAWGGVAGTGIALGRPDKIPVVYNDFIFAAIGEELGLLGATAVLMAYLLMVGAGLRIAVQAEGAFEKLAGHRADRPPRHPELHHHRRRHAPAPAHRHRPAVRFLRRLVARRQLHPPRAVVAHLRRHRPAGEGPGGCASRRDGDAVNTQIRRLGAFLMACFVALFVQLNYVQVLRAHDLNTKPGNSRPVDQAFSRPRGTVSTADGTVIARSVPSNDHFKYQREFPEKDLFGFVTGYFNFSFGATGLEASYNNELSGRTTNQQIRSLSDLFVDHDHTGNLKLTLRKDVQEVARQQLGNRKGSVVAINPKTGAILAFWSYPSYDPNALSSHGRSASVAKNLLEASPDKPLLPRMYRETFFPGSTFKVVTGSVGVQSGMVTQTQPVYPAVSSYTPPQTNRPLRNFGGEVCGGVLFDILAKSCNTVLCPDGRRSRPAPHDHRCAGVRVQRQAADRSAGGRPFPFPDQLRSEPAGARAVVDRAELGVGDAAADGARRGRDRQRRHDHGASSPRRDPQRRRRPREEGAPDRSGRRRSARRPPTPCAKP